MKNLKSNMNNFKVHLVPKFVFAKREKWILLGAFLCKLFLNRSNPRFSVPSQSTENRTKNTANLAYDRV